MDDTEYRKKLSEVAEWEIPKLTITDINQAKQKARGRRSNEDKYQEEHEQVFAELFDGINPTAPPQILKLKKQATICDDCGCHCDQGRYKEIKLYETGKNKKRNWRERCVTCNKNKNPFTGKFDLTPSEAPHVWTTYLRETKGLYKTEANEAREEAIVIRNAEEIYKDGK